MNSWNEQMQLLSVELVPFFMALVFHEYAHAAMANYWGDRTAQSQGRLTLNPLPHLDPIGSILFPILGMLSGSSFLFAWARPVPINEKYFRKLKPGIFWTALAGPAMNWFLALCSAVVFCLLEKWLPPTFFLHQPLILMAYISVRLNYTLMIFNLIPLPPLDGSKVLEVFLPYAYRRQFEQISQYSFFIFLALMMTGAFSILQYPIRFFTEWTLILTTTLFGVSSSGV
ncbi:MAG: site-2 protease family protein [Bdellovibrionia bacterium]